jgi:hypothetical protein
MANFQLDDDYVGAIKTLIQKKKDKKTQKTGPRITLCRYSRTH